MFFLQPRNWFTPFNRFSFDFGMLTAVPSRSSREHFSRNVLFSPGTGSHPSQVFIRFRDVARPPFSRSVHFQPRNCFAPLMVLIRFREVDGRAVEIFNRASIFPTRCSFFSPGTGSHPLRVFIRFRDVDGRAVEIFSRQLHTGRDEARD